MNRENKTLILEKLKQIYKDGIKTQSENEELHAYAKELGFDDIETDKIERDFIKSNTMDMSIKTYSSVNRANEVYEDIARQAVKNLETNTFPFNKRPPYEANMNLVSGSTLLTVQTLLMELKMAALGEKQYAGKWIWGADAAALGLELDPEKNQGNLEGTKPMTIFANTRKMVVPNAFITETNQNQEGLKLDCQCAYFLDQFTPKSVSSAFRNLKDKIVLNNEKVSDEEASKIVNHIFGNLAQTSYSSEFVRECHDNLSNNLSTKTKEIAEEKNNIRQNRFKGFTPEEDKVFTTVRNYFLVQRGIKIKNEVLATDEEVKAVFEYGGAERFAELMFAAMAHADRMTHPNFSYEAQYKTADMNRKSTPFSRYLESAKSFISPRFINKFKTPERNAETLEKQRSRSGRADAGFGR